MKEFKLGLGEWMVPGGDLTDRGQKAQALGYQGVELFGDTNLYCLREKEVLIARDAGVEMPTICSIGEFIGDTDADKRRGAIDHVKSLVTILAKAEGEGVVLPAAYGLHSNVLPRPAWPRSAAEDRRVLVDGLSEIGEHALKQGVAVYLEPLNRYEDHMVNTVDQAREIVEEVGNPSVQVMADTFHMNVEEDDVRDTLLRNSAVVKHVHLADNQRQQPGTGQIDFVRILSALDAMNYDGYLTLECGIRGEREEALRYTAQYLRALHELYY
jgi:sugar phosphate isomerase/epimerase